MHHEEQLLVQLFIAFYNNLCAVTNSNTHMLKAFFEAFQSHTASHHKLICMTEILSQRSYIES